MKIKSRLLSLSMLSLFLFSGVVNVFAAENEKLTVVDTDDSDPDNGYPYKMASDSLQAIFEQPHTLEVERIESEIIDFGNLFEGSKVDGYVEKKVTYKVTSSANYNMGIEGTSNFEGHDTGGDKIPGAVIPIDKVLQLMKELPDGGGTIEVPHRFPEFREESGKTQMLDIEIDCPATGINAVNHEVVLRAEPVIGATPAKAYKASLNVVIEQH